MVKEGAAEQQQFCFTPKFADNGVISVYNNREAPLKLHLCMFRR